MSRHGLQSYTLHSLIKFVNFVTKLEKRKNHGKPLPPQKTTHKIPQNTHTWRGDVDGGRVGGGGVGSKEIVPP